MNLYDLHNKPEILHGLSESYKIPDIAYEEIWKVERRREPYEHLLKYIYKDPKYAFTYCTNIRRERWYKAEPYIMKSPEYATKYAIYIIKGKWEEAEEYIEESPKWWNIYAVQFGLESMNDTEEQNW